MFPRRDPVWTSNTMMGARYQGPFFASTKSLGYSGSRGALALGSPSWLTGKRASIQIDMEGNGPLQGERRKLNRIVLADDPVAADASCPLLMGLNSRSVLHIQERSHYLGNAESKRIVMIGEPMPRSIEPFSLLPDFRYLLRQPIRGDWNLLIWCSPAGGSGTPYGRWKFTLFFCSRS